MTYSFKRLWRMLVLSLIVGHPVGLHAQLPPEATARALKAAATRLTLEELEAARPIPALDSLVANARVVMLGEAWHGDGGAIRLRAAMVQYLHRRHGFDVLAFEADFISLEGGWREAVVQRRESDFARENVYPMWSESGASSSLWKYITSTRSSTLPLEVTGFDPRITGRWAREHLADSIRAWATSGGAATSEGEAFFHRLTGFLENERRSKPVAGPEGAAFRAHLDALTDRVLQKYGERSFASQAMRSLGLAVDYAWNDASRDKAMGRNAAWLLLNRFPDRKVVVWAHNNHIILDKWMYFASADPQLAKNLAAMSAEVKGRYTYLGEEIYRLIGPRAVSIATLSAGGRFSPEIQTSIVPRYANFANTKTLTVPGPGSIEQVIAGLPGALQIVPLRGGALERLALSSRALDFSQAPPFLMRYGMGYDAFLVIDCTFALEDAPTFRDRTRCGTP